MPQVLAQSVADSTLGRIGHARNPSETDVGQSLPTRRLDDNVVRPGTTDPALVTLANQWLATIVAIATLALTWFAFRVPLFTTGMAFGLVTVFVSRQVFSAGRLHVGAAPGYPLKFAYVRRLLEWSAIFAILIFVIYTFNLIALFPKRAILTWYVATAMALIFSNTLPALTQKWLSRRSRAAHRYIIVGINGVGVELLRRFERTTTGGEFLGYFDFRSPDRISAASSDRLNGHCRNMPDFVRRHAINAIYIALPMSKAPRIEGLLQELRDTAVSIYFVPDVFAFDLVQPRCVDIGGMPVLSICDTPYQGIDGFQKRLSDILLASLALLLLTPLMLAAAVAVKLTSAGPVVFRQRRYGLNGEEILVYKFRTMSVCEDGGQIRQAIKHDRRFTRVGAFLRRTSIDELPQLYNVLQGTMSIVGPRPHAVAHNEQYRKLVSGYMMRYKVRPGITGWAQVNGLRGETDTVEKMRRRVHFDLDYVKNWSLGLDVKIIFKTALGILNDDNAY